MRKHIRNFLRGLSFTTAMFVVQACYGTGEDFGIDMLVEGQVTSKNSGNPIKGIKVLVDDTGQYGYTDENGGFSFYTELLEEVNLKFEDVDADENGSFAAYDTVFKADTNQVYLDIKLEQLQ